MKLSPEKGKQLIKLARLSINGKEIDLDGFEEKKGVFVTINSYPSKKLRGCIGFPKPIMPLKKAVVEAAKSAAYSDSRFDPLESDEQFTIELSVLTVPELISGNLLDLFTIGKHGLIIEHKGKYGLLLPQVFSDYRSTPLEALQMTCEKAGVSLDAWKENDCKVYKFEAQIFIEETPNGNVVEKEQ